MVLLRELYGPRTSELVQLVNKFLEACLVEFVGPSSGRLFEDSVAVLVVIGKLHDVDDEFECRIGSGVLECSAQPRADLSR